MRLLPLLLLALVGCSSSPEETPSPGEAAGSPAAGAGQGGGGLAGAAGHGGLAGQAGAAGSASSGGAGHGPAGSGGSPAGGASGGSGQGGAAGKGGAGSSAGGAGGAASGAGGSGAGGGAGSGGAAAGSGGASAGGGGAGEGGSGGSGGEEAGELPKTLTFVASQENFLNPERGFYDVQDLLAPGDWPSFREEGHALVYTGVRLDDYRDGPLDAGLLQGVADGLAAARAAGVKVVLRFQYNDGPIGAEDASEATIKGHIAQLAPVLAAGADVIALVHAGFIGAWGEWHSSTHGLDTDAKRGAVLQALLGALPASRMVAVRTPHYVDGIFPGGPLPAAEAFSGTDRARVAQHNDCFLASDDDEGTYLDPVATWKAYVASDGRFTPIGGETCATNLPRTGCDVATAEMEQLHFSYLNQLYEPDVVAGWQSEGCFAEIQRRLGYRLRLTSGSYTPAVKPGGVLALAVVVRNEGWGPLYNARPLAVVIDGQGQRYEATLPADPRSFGPGQETAVQVRLRLPASAPPGAYRISLWMPDEAPALRPDPRYAVRLANEATWDETTGLNILATDLAIDPAAKGASDPAAAGLTVLP